MARKMMLCVNCRRVFAAKEDTNMHNCKFCGCELIKMAIPVEKWQSLSDEECKKTIKMIMNTEYARELIAHAANAKNSHEMESTNSIERSGKPNKEKNDNGERKGFFIFGCLLLCIVAIIAVVNYSGPSQGIDSSGQNVESSYASEIPIIIGDVGNYELSETQIIDDICEKSKRIEGHKINSLEISKRETNDETDHMFAKVISEDENAVYDSNYELYYEKYNQGWILKIYTFRGLSYVAKHPEVITEEMADNILSEKNFDSFNIIERVEEDNKVRFLFKATDYNNYLNKEYEGNICYSFSPNDLWTSEYTIDEYYLEPDIVGEWEFRDSTRYYHVTILDFSDDSITLTYYLEGAKNPSKVTTFDGTPDTITYQSESAETYELHTYSYSEDSKIVYVNVLDDWFDKVNFWIYTGETDNGGGLSFDGNLLQRVS